MDYRELIEKQKAYFTTGATRSPERRLEALSKLEDALEVFRDRLFEALREDLNKSPHEAYITEISIVHSELKYVKRRLKRWMRDKRVKPNIGFIPNKSYMSPEPYGVVLIVSPWNYPVNLALMPLIGAIAAGNCAVVKNSAKAPHTAAVLAEMIASAFPEEYVAVVNAAREECGDLLRQPWDYVFFTGSQAGGRQVLEAAAENLVPATLELGGKNPVIIDPSANLKIAAKRLAFGKCLNAGQTCIAPDYVLIHESIRDAFVREYEKVLKKKYFRKGDMSQMAVIVNDAHFRRIMRLMEGQKVVIGGGSDPERRFIEPTVLTDVAVDSPIMQEEIFGPVLPLITWTDLDWCIDLIHTKDKPLALYVFSKDKEVVRQVFDRCSFGGGCVNDVILQLSAEELAFGGVGGSGMGQYHGRASFDTFTHYRAICERHAFPEQNLRHFPFTKLKFAIARRFL